MGSNRVEEEPSVLADKHQPFFSNFPSALIIKIEHIKISKLVYIHKKVQELANGTASARDLNRDLSRFSNPTPIGDRLGGEKFKDRDAGAASC